MAEPEERQVTLYDYLRVLYRGRWIIILAFAIIAAAALILSFLISPIYEAKTTIMIEQDGGMQQSLFGVSGFMERETEINNQVEILKSRTLAEEVLAWLQESGAGDRFSIIRALAEGATRDDAVQTLRNNLTIVPLRDGMLKLPAVTLNWWDIDGNRVEQAASRLLMLEVLPGPGGLPAGESRSPAPDRPTADSGAGPGWTVIIGVVFAFAVGWWLRGRSQQGDRIRAADFLRSLRLRTMSALQGGRAFFSGVSTPS